VASASTRTVLVVDDDPFIRRLIVTTLQDVAGFALVEAKDGDDALALAARARPAVVFLDIDMPGINGIEACRRLREGHEGNDSTVIVMLTAGVEHEQAARDAGADLFLTKPFSPLDLLRLVDELGR
jgi:CheY-like chemotaxis protein